MPIIKTVRPITDEFLCRAWVDAADMQVLADLLLESNLVGKLPDTLYIRQLPSNTSEVRRDFPAFFDNKHSYHLEIECRCFILQTLKAARRQFYGLYTNSHLMGSGSYPDIEFRVGIMASYTTNDEYRSRGERWEWSPGSLGNAQERLLLRPNDVQACNYCHTTSDNVSWVAQPYDLGIQGKTHMMYLCDGCYKSVSDDI